MVVFSYLLRIAGAVNVVLVGDGGERGSASMNGKIKIAADVGMFSGDHFEMVFVSEIFNMRIWCSSSDDNFARIFLL